MRNVGIAAIALSLLFSSRAYGQLGGTLGDAAKQLGSAAVPRGGYLAARRAPSPHRPVRRAAA
jgi:hypothetical protein